MASKKWMQSLFFSVASGGFYLVAILLTYFLRHSELMEAQLFSSFYLFILIAGMIAILFTYKRFGIILFSGSIIGLMVDCITTYMEAERPTMAGGIYNIFITIIFFVAAIIVQVVHEVKKRRK